MKILEELFKSLIITPGEQLIPPEYPSFLKPGQNFFHVEFGLPERIDLARKIVSLIMPKLTDLPEIARVEFANVCFCMKIFVYMFMYVYVYMFIANVCFCMKIFVYMFMFVRLKFSIQKSRKTFNMFAFVLKPALTLLIG